MTQAQATGQLLLGRVAVLVPVKAFRAAKVRLAPALPGPVTPKRGSEP